jgi:hypothetical protein
VISYVLRLRPEEVADGRFVGEVEAVASRRRRRIRTIEQITSFILATLANEVDASTTARQVANDEEPDTDDPGEMNDPDASDDPAAAHRPPVTERRR